MSAAPRMPTASSERRDDATAATTAHVARLGVWAVRVHDVVGTVDTLDVAENATLRGPG